MNPLDQLKDIHLPQDVSIWPLAWPWWVLGAAILICIILGFYLRHKNRWRKLALQQLNLINTQDKNLCIRQCNRLLKQVALSRFDRSCASLSGTLWLEFLDQKIKKPIFIPNFSEFASAPDMEQTSLDVHSLKVAVESWIRKIKC